MLTTAQRIEYFLDSAIRYLTKIKCPNCGCESGKLIDSKYMVTRLFECNQCHLCFRHPVEKVNENKKFYQDDYVESDNITAILPDKNTLKDLISKGFKTGNKSAERYIQLFRLLSGGRSDSRVVDYGSSWGYISYQIRQAGFDLQSFEISKIRADYGNKNLGLEIKTNEAALEGNVDIFFSSHVIEHHPDIPGMMNLAGRLLKPDGLFIAVCPNGSEEFRKNNFYSFHHSWGKVHPNYLTNEFYQKRFSNNPYYIGSSPFNFDRISKFDREQYIDSLCGEELILITQMNVSI